MRYIANRKTSTIVAAVISVVSGVVLQLIGGVVFAILAGKGRVAEDTVFAASLVLQGISVAVVALVAWMIVPQDAPNLAWISATGLFVFQIVTGLLFWRIEWLSVLYGLVVTVVVLGTTIFLLNRQKKSRGVLGKKMRYR